MTAGSGRLRIAAFLLISCILHVLLVVIPLDQGAEVRLRFKPRMRLPNTSIRMAFYRNHAPRWTVQQDLEHLRHFRPSVPEEDWTLNGMIDSQEIGDVLPQPWEPLTSPAAKALVWLDQREYEVDLNELELAKVARLAADREYSVLLALPDADTSDGASRLERAAVRVVQKAIEAMEAETGALMKIHRIVEFQWVETTENWLPGLGRVDVPRYLFPVARLEYAPFQGMTRKPILHEERLDLTLGEIPLYQLRSPVITRRRYTQEFADRWKCLPSVVAKRRAEGESVRWHFADRFLGHGVRLTYLGTEIYKGRRADAIKVDDRIYGGSFIAYFCKRTKLLIATVERLRNDEIEYLRRHAGGRPPTWTTEYASYQWIDGILTPTVLRRSGLTVHRVVAYNGTEPSADLPSLE